MAADSAYRKEPLMGVSSCLALLVILGFLARISHCQVPVRSAMAGLYPGKT